MSLLIAKRFQIMIFFTTQCRQNSALLHYQERGHFMLQGNIPTPTESQTWIAIGPRIKIILMHEE